MRYENKAARAFTKKWDSKISTIFRARWYTVKILRRKRLVMDFGRILTEKEALALNPLALAYVGDAVQSLYVRHRLVAEHDFKAGELHKLTSALVNAKEQAVLAEKLLDVLTETERSVYLRGRNGKSHHKAKIKQARITVKLRD